MLGDVQARAQQYKRDAAAHAETHRANEAARRALDDSTWKLEEARRRLDRLLPGRQGG